MYMNIESEVKSLEEFNQFSQLLNDEKQLYVRDLFLPEFITRFLPPSFYKNHPELWKKVFEHLLDFINDSDEYMLWIQSQNHYLDIGLTNWIMI